MSGEGNSRVDPLPFGKLWDYFVRRLWGYQWTATSTPLTPEWSQRLYDYTQGNPAVTVKFYQALQRDALERGGNEALTLDGMRQVWLQNFNYMPVPPALHGAPSDQSLPPQPSDFATAKARKAVAKPPKAPSLSGLLEVSKQKKVDPLKILQAMGVVKSANEWFPGGEWPSEDGPD